MTDAILLTAACMALGCTAVCAYLMARMYLDRSAAGQAATLPGKSGPPPNPHDKDRSPQWPAFERAWLRDHPRCDGCGTTEDCEVHHKLPFHVNRALELDRSNVKTLCRHPGRWCHYRYGHDFNWDDWNTDVDHDAAAELARLASHVPQKPPAPGGKP